MSRYNGRAKCPVCDARGLKPLVRLPSMPVYANLLWDTSESAKNCPRGDIDLCFCPRCQFLTNLSFNPDLVSYSGGYDNTLAHSAVFRAYQHGLAERLIDRFG